MMVYVDALINYGWVLNGRNVKNCHLLADTVEELHEFAVNVLGMKRVWFQSGSASTMPHYDLVPKRRQKAVEHGAIEISREQVVLMQQTHRLRQHR